VNRLLALVLVAGRRLAGGLLLLVGATFLIYVTIRSAPGDAIDAITPMGTPPEVKEQLAADFGLDQEPLAGYVTWLGRSAQGDFGESLVTVTGEEVMTAALPAFRNTLLLSFAALLVCQVLATLLAVVLGEPSSRQQVLTGALYFVTAAPSFVAAIFFSQALNAGIRHFVDTNGYEPPDWYPIPIDAKSIMQYVFAGLMLIAGDGLFMDMFNTVRAEISAVRNAQFIAAVRAKGASTAPHTLRNLVVPFISAFAARLPLVLGSVVIVEYFFTLDGAGYLLLEASKQRDFPIVVGLSVLFTLSIIVMNLLADVVRAAIDPREVARNG
jgi:peptide/nickel transport system permease protein